MVVSRGKNLVSDGSIAGKNFREFRVLEKNYTQKTKFYMVHTLFLTDSRKFNPAKYTTYTVIIISLYSIDAISSVIIMKNMSILFTVFLRYKLSKTFKIGYHFEKSPSSLHVG